MPDDVARPPACGRGRAGRTTIRDVAARAGVSTGTVSHFVNTPEKLAPETARRIQRAIDDLGWVLDQGAQQLRRGGGQAVGVIIATLGPHTVELFGGVESGLADGALIPQLVTTGHDPERELQRIELFERQRARGLLLSPGQDHEAHLARLRQLAIPVVLIGRTSAAAEVSSVAGDDVAGGRMAVEHLLGQGHRRLLLVGGTAASRQVQLRIEGATTALTPDAVLTVLPTPGYGIDAGLAAAHHLAGSPAQERPTAVFAMNDSIATGLQRGLQTAGLRVPEDVAVIGYDDVSLAATAPVPLSTIHVAGAELGRRAAVLLRTQIEDLAAGRAPVHQQVQLEPRLIVRASTKLPDQIDVVPAGRR